AFFAGQTPQRSVSVFGCDPKFLVSYCGIVDLRHDGACHMLCAFNAVEGRIRLDRNATDIAIELLKPARCADERTAGAQHRDKVRHTAFGLPPDLLRGAVIMRSPVRVIRVLVRVEVFLWLRSGEFPRFPDGSVGPFRRVSEYDFCTVGTNGSLTLRGYVSRHAQGHRESLRRSQHGIGNSGIAAGGVQQSFTWAKLSSARGLGHNIRGWAVFHRT